MVLLFSFFFCSGGFLVAHGEPVPADGFLTGDLECRYLEGSSNRLAGTVPFSLIGSSGTLSGVMAGDDVSGHIAGQLYSSSNFNPGTLQYIQVSYMSSFYLKKDLVYVLTMNYASKPSSSLSVFDSSWSSPYDVLSRSSNTLVFSPKSDFKPYYFVQYFSGGTTSAGSTGLSGNFAYRYGGFISFSLQCLPSVSRDTYNLTSEIQKQTDALDQSITDAGQGVQDKIESQFDTSQGSEVGSAAQDFADQAAESLGVVSYIDTLFSGLSGLVISGSTTLTFPAFAIAVQGTDYQVWQEHTFDLSQLDGWFSGLMAAVRLATSVVVVGAVIHYLQSVYKDVIG